MRRIALRTAELLVLPTIGLVLALAAVPRRDELIAHVYLVVVLAVLLAVLVQAIHASRPHTGPSTFELGLRPRPAPRPERLPELARTEREVALGLSTAFDLHYRLRPTLREVAAGLLAARRGIDLDRHPDRARAALGEEAWELVRPDRPAPYDRYAPGLDTAALRRVVESLEALA